MHGTGGFGKLGIISIITQPMGREGESDQETRTRDRMYRVRTSTGQQQEITQNYEA